MMTLVAGWEAHAHLDDTPGREPPSGRTSHGLAACRCTVPLPRHAAMTGGAVSHGFAQFG